MTPDEARELFSAAWDGELDEAERAAFDALLEADAELRSEWEEFRDLLREAHEVAESDEAEAPDLLPGVQQRLRVRSRGRFYRDRFAAEATGGRTMLPLLLGLAMFVAVAVAWLTLHVVHVEPASPAPSAPAAPAP